MVKKKKRMKPKKKKNNESKIQKKFIRYLERGWKNEVFWMHPPVNVKVPKLVGNKRKKLYSQSVKTICKRIGMENKLMGTRAGCCDVLIFGPNGKTLHIEFKTTDGVLSKVQKTVHTLLNRLRHDVVVCRSSKSAILVFRDWIDAIYTQL